MHFVFVNDKPIILTTKVEKETDFKNFLLKDVSLKRVLRTLKKKQYNSVRLIHHNEKTLLKHFCKKLPKVIAGGGKVKNEAGEILFIYRKHKWDLPKGKAEKNETIKETAIREVEEETGVKNLKIVDELATTYHIFRKRGKSRLKVTYWYNMTSDYTGKLNPQQNEGITKVEWLNKDEVKKAMGNSYANIKLLIE
jgi:8-oxo-dGTP pyrophosphatase MutT (NUDIX family)